MPTTYRQPFFSKQEYTTALLDVKHDTSLRRIDFRLGKVSQEKVRLPLTLSDLLELRDRKIAIRIEICENGAVAFLEAEDDFFATGKIIKEARENLIKSLEDKLSLTVPRNRYQV